MVRLPVGILPPPRDRRDLRFNAHRRRRSLDLLRAFELTRHAFHRMSQAF